ncbi:MAG TPA: phage tail sheath family protein [Herpetosiphonaceae bacterium]
MPEYLAPGVYVEEINVGPRPIEGVSTSTAAFLGETERGPEAPKLITSFLQYQRWYGGYIPDRSYLTYAVQGFFDNGGQRCFVGRIVSGTLTLVSNTRGGLLFRAIGRGRWGGNIMIKIEDASQRNRNPDWFRLTVLWYARRPDPFIDPTSQAVADLTNKARRDPDALEVYDNLTHQPGASNNVITVVNAASQLVRVAWPGGPTTAAPVGNADLDWLGDEGDADPVLDDSDFIGDDRPVAGVADDLLGRGRGLTAIEMIDEVSLLCVPDHVHAVIDSNIRDAIREAVLNQCETLKDRFAILSVDQGQNDPQLPAPNGLIPPRDTSYGAIYHPWIEVFDPPTNSRRRIPPVGHVTGIIARTDIERGVHKAPANEVVRGALNLEFPVPKRLQDMLNPRGINCIRDFRSDGRGIRLWGARTMASDPLWKYINVRRLFLYIEESIDEGTQWVVFEPNDFATWAAVTRTITNFLISVWRSGGLMGLTQEEAFFVRCDRTTMSQDDIDNGRLICVIGIAPVKPAEFVIFRISQKTADAQQA